jgi:large subunit ribosomal protein L9
MEVILTKNHEHLGNQGDVVKVKSGYAVNFLFPNQLAVVSNQQNKRHYQVLANQRKRKLQNERSAQEALAQKLNSAPVLVKAKAGKSGKLFGSITGVQISEAVKHQLGVEIDRRRIKLTEAIRGAGDFKVNAKLFHEVNTTFTVRVEVEIVKDVVEKIEKKKKRGVVSLDEVVEEKTEDAEAGEVKAEESGDEGETKKTRKPRAKKTKEETEE